MRRVKIHTENRNMRVRGSALAVEAMRFVAGNGTAEELNRAIDEWGKVAGGINVK